MGALVGRFIDGVGTLYKGGPMLIPLLFFSILATSIVLERLRNLRRERLIPAEYIARIYRLLERGKYDLAIALCESRPLLITDLLKTGIRNRHLDERTLVKEMREYIRQHTADLYRNLFMLALVAGVAPLLGLLGTVIGMIYSFAALQEGGGNVQFRVVADGISVALLTTFAGLAVAVPTIVAHQYLVDRADHMKRELQRYGVSLVRFLKADELYGFGIEASDEKDDTEIQIQWEGETSS